ncbi:MAG: glycoside hydrolase family protein [Labilithrix sp.]|nr:glycoside hydrolase family protein [Labilithrix sp.]
MNISKTQATTLSLALALAACSGGAASGDSGESRAAATDEAAACGDGNGQGGSGTDASSGPSSNGDAGPSAPPGALPGGDLEAARAFMKPLALGVNVERSWAWAVPGGPKAEAQYLASLGVTHVRVFFPWSPTNDFGLGTGVPGAAAYKTFLDAIAQWIEGGLTVFADCTDVLGAGDFAAHGGDIHAVVKNLGDMAATYGFSPTRFALGPVNEWAGDDGKGGDPFAAERLALHDILRASLPGYVLTASSEYWDYFKNLAHLTPLADQRIIYSFHSYEAHSAADWKATAADPLKTWSASHGGLPVLWGEAGVGNSYNSNDSSNPAVWPGNVTTMASAMAVFRPTLWAITYGGEWRLNGSSSDAHVRSDLSGAVTAAAASTKTALAGNNGAP